MGDTILFSIISGILGVFLGVAIMIAMTKIGLNQSKSEADLILSESKSKAENTLRQAVLDGKTQVYELKLEAEKEIKNRKSELHETEAKLSRREDTLNFRDETCIAKEKQIDDKNQKAADKLQKLEKMETELQEKIDVQINELERVASMSALEAKKELMDVVEKKMDKEVSIYIKNSEDEAKARASDNAKNIIALAIQRFAQEETIEQIGRAHV